VTSGLLLDVLDVVLAQTPGVLVPPGRIPLLRRVASLLPPVLPAGLELRLGTGGPVDLQQNVLAQDGQREIAARHFGDLLTDERSRAGLGWDPIERFLSAWSNSTAPWRERVQDLWLEFDLQTNQPAVLPLPSVFIGLAARGIPGEEAPPTLETILTAILSAPLPPTTLETLRHCCAACPERGRISHIGLMLSRPSAGLRLNVARVPADRIAAYLETIRWPGSASRAEGLLDRIFPLVDGVTLALDVGGSLGPRLGLECPVRERLVHPVRQAALLDLLVELGCCSAAERDALLAWPGVIGPSQSRAPWPSALIAGDIARPAGLSTISSRINHVKLDIVEGAPLRAKAYLSFRPRWLEATTEGAAADPDEAAANAHAGVSEPAGALDHAIEAALDFLSTTRGQSGLWRDFDSFDGGSDEWVSSVVGAILAEIGRPDTRREALSTWRVLTRRARQDGGWGWNVLVAPDADTTSWVLMLAEAIGEGHGEPASRARKLLDQHRAPGGGLGTYRPLAFPDLPPEAVRGWTVAHDCVSAAAAALAGAIGAGARRHLRASQRSDGSWRPYWWSDAAYATALAAEALASRGSPSDATRVGAAVAWAAQRVGPDGAVTAQALEGPAPFATAWVIRALGLGAGEGAPGVALEGDAKRARDALERATAWLVRNQRADGSWRSSADMWVPPRDALPDELPKGAILYFDERRIFTTAVALSALLRAKRVLEER
jgi:hypothetical protein